MDAWIVAALINTILIRSRVWALINSQLMPCDAFCSVIMSRHKTRQSLVEAYTEACMELTGYTHIRSVGIRNMLNHLAF